MKRKKELPTDPQPSVLHAELQEAVNNAYSAVMFHRAMALGLLDGPEIDVESCGEILEVGRAHGLRPQKHAVIELMATEIDAEDPTFGRRFARKLWEEVFPRMNGRGH